MHTFVEKPRATQQTTSAKSETLNRGHFGYGHEEISIFHLQRAIGNQALLRRLQTNHEPHKSSASMTATTKVGHDFSQIPVRSTALTRLQTELTVNTPGDINEQMADHVADEVMRMQEPLLHHDYTSRGGCLRCRSQVEHMGQKKTALQDRQAENDNTQTLVAAGFLDQVLGSVGRPLDAGVRAFMEPRFGCDFRHVRVHTGVNADNVARAVSARAFTIGSNVVFAAKQYSPETSTGRRLIAHELAHTLQKGGQDEVVIRREPADSPGWGEQVGDWVFGETEGEKKDTGASPGVIWRWLSWFGIGLTDFLAGVVSWFGFDSYDIAADLIRHYMSGRGAEFELDMPETWAQKIAAKYPKTGTYKDVSSYKWGIPDLRNSLGHFDLVVDKNADGSKTYKVTDQYEFPSKPNDVWQTGRHGFQVPFFGALPTQVQQGVNTALAALGTWYNPGGFDEVFEVKLIGSEWTLLVPQQWLADSGVDFSIHSEFTVSAGGKIDAGGWF